MPRDTHAAVREICLSFPEAEEVESHGSPNFRVRGKTFAMYAVNHHGDGRIALWLNAPAGAQDFHTRDEPRHFFVPPYVGPRGWLGVRVESGLPWKRVALQVRKAYEKVAPPALASRIGATIEIAPPRKALTLADVDPFSAPAAAALLREMRRICLALPETSEGTQFGSPVWRVGKKTFAQTYHSKDRIKLSFRVGAFRQSLLTADPRFSIPKYSGHLGWIDLDASRRVDWRTVRGLALESYRHFAPRRAVAKLAETSEAAARPAIRRTSTPRSTTRSARRRRVFS
jgi:hypothetical protein